MVNREIVGHVVKGGLCFSATLLVAFGSFCLTRPSDAQSVTWITSEAITASAAYAVSDTGVVVGFGYFPDYRQFLPIRWTSGAGIQILYERQGEATCVSRDGNAAAGWLSVENNPRAFYWNQDRGGVVWIDDSPNWRTSVAHGISIDGRVVVGHAVDREYRERAFRWTEDRGMEDLNVVFASILGGSLLLRAYGASEEGGIIVGTGIHNGVQQGFVLNTRVPEIKWGLNEVRAVSPHGDVVVGSESLVGYR